MRLMTLLVVLFLSLAARADIATVLVNDDGVVLHDTNIVIQGESWSGDWYLPEQQASGLVYLQHGFTRGGGNYRDLGLALMAEGFMVLSVNAPMSGGNEPLARAVAATLAQDAFQPPGGASLPGHNVVLSGHSAGGLHVSLIAERLIELGEHHRISGMVLLDPVNSFGPFPRAMAAVANTSIPVKAITANASLCNSLNDTQKTLRDLPRNFVGIKLTDRSRHTDAEGENTDALAVLACGKPRGHNVVALRDAMTAWSRDMLTGGFSQQWYPGGSELNALQNAGRARLLGDSSGAWATVKKETIGGSWYSTSRYQIEVPEGVPVGEVEISLGGGSGHADLYVRRGETPSRWRYDCRSTGWGSNESCSLYGPGTYHVMVYTGFRGYSGVQLQGRYFEH